LSYSAAYWAIPYKFKGYSTAMGKISDKICYNSYRCRAAFPAPPPYYVLKNKIYLVTKNQPGGRMRLRLISSAVVLYTAVAVACICYAGV
jgi:hypothetical protein